MSLYSACLVGRQLRRAVLLLLLLFSLRAAGQTLQTPPKPYSLSVWGEFCASKGRFQDKEYFRWETMDRILADGKAAIPVLISQITDARVIDKQVFCYWPQIRVGDLAHFVLLDLFLDETWTHRTMPDLFPGEHCQDTEPGWVCWARLRKKYGMASIQARWAAFWKANQNRIYWDAKSLCFRLRQ